MGDPFSLRSGNQLHGHATGHADGQRDSIIADERSSGAEDGLLRKTQTEGKRRELKKRRGDGKEGGRA